MGVLTYSGQESQFYRTSKTIVHCEYRSFPLNFSFSVLCGATGSMLVGLGVNKLRSSTIH